MEKMANQFYYKGESYEPHSALSLDQSAFQRMKKQHIFLIGALLFLYFVLLIINWHLVLLITIAILSLLYFTDLLFNLFLIVRSFSKSPELKISDRELERAGNREWPTYTVLCPLYKEWEVLPQFIESMSALDYPKDKLQVMILLEEDDTETIEKVKEFLVPKFFKGAIVPHSLPKTKPKALNYGMNFATGEYVVVYDAEDIPEVDQLKKSVLAFEKAGRKVVCIQAKLNFYNPYQNLLTRIFTAEYSLWFDLVLTGLQSINAPIPLGGTSNHFRKQDLLDLKGWDSFNVTEDADLGIRLAKAGYQTAIVDSTTHEEANSDYLNWFYQRSRWIKGYIQTYFVHMRNPKTFMNKRNIKHFLAFNMIIGGKILSMFINPFMWLVTLSYIIFRPYTGALIESLFPAPIIYIAVFSLIFGNFLYFYYYLIGCAKRGHGDIMKYLFVVPFYWLAMSAAAWLATYKFIYQPFYWSKTKHGLHLKTEPVVVDNVIDQRVLPSVA